ncbi:3-oxoacyl-[acyl-carrier-protein] synthase-3 [Rathayibacter agropyri]
MASTVPPMTIAALAMYLPTSVELAKDAEARGVLSSKNRSACGVSQVPVEHDLSAPDMAIRACSDALTGARVRAEDVSAIFYASTFFQGASFWSPAHYIAQSIGATNAIPIGISAMCNGSGTALDLAQRYLATSAPDAMVMVCTADRFPDASFDRWGGDYGVVYGDGATAGLFGGPARRPPFMRVLASQTIALSELESMHRPADGLYGSASDEPVPHLVRPHKRAFLARHGKESLTQHFASALRSLIPKIHAQIGLPVGDPAVSHVYVPRVGVDTIDSAYRPVLEEEFGLSIRHLAAQTGHLGAGDTIANLSESEKEEDNDSVRLFLSVGAGFTLTLIAAESVQ